MKIKISLHRIISFVLLWTIHWGIGQEDSTAIWTGEFYLETYYGYDFGQPDDHNRPDFIYSHHRHNELNLNLGLAQIGYDSESLRGNIGLMVGTYPNKNMAHEPVHYRNIYQANIGLKLLKSQHLWLNVGVLESHIGFEGAKGAEYGFMTRSILADNSPYYSTGAELSYQNNTETLELRALFINGWQTIQRPTGNQSLALGHQLLWTPNKSITLNSSSFIGNIYPEDEKRMRYFHNFFMLINLKNSLITAGLDLGAEQTSINSKSYNHWTGATIGWQYFPNDNLTLGLRSEYFRDEANTVLLAPDRVNNLGLSLNIDYALQKNSLIRWEVKGFKNEYNIFNYRGNLVDYNLYIGASLCFFISHSK